MSKPKAAKAKTQLKDPRLTTKPEWFIEDWDGSASGKLLHEVPTHEGLVYLPESGDRCFELDRTVPPTVLVSGFIRQYQRAGIVPVEAVLGEELGDFKKMFRGHSIKMDSLRYRTFKTHGCTCVTCGVKGTYFAIERSINRFMQPTTETYHLNLWGIDANGNEVLFTKDHILPKSLGGPDRIENMQTMCTVCNLEKGATV